MVIRHWHLFPSIAAAVGVPSLQAAAASSTVVAVKEAGSMR